MAENTFDTPTANLAPMPPQGMPIGADTPMMRMLSVENAEQAMKRQNEEDRARDAANTQVQAKPVVVALGAHIDTCRQRAADARRTSGVEQRLIDAMRRRRGEYEPGKEAELKKIGQVPVWAGITEVKCLGLEARLAEAYQTDDGRPPITVEPTPMPELPDDVVAQIVNTVEQQAAQDIQTGAAPMTKAELWQVANAYASRMREMMLAQMDKATMDAAAAMQKKIDDQLVEGQFDDAMSVFRSNLVTFGTSIIEGPVLRRKKQIVGYDPQTMRLKIEDRVQMSFEPVNPLDFFPAPHATDCNDGYNLIRVRFSRAGLISMKGTAGVIDAAIETVLSLYGQSGLRTEQPSDMSRRSLEDKQIAFTDDDTIEGYVFRGSIQGRMLIEADPRMLMDGVKPTAEYDIKAITIGPHVVKIALNSDPTGARDVFKACLYPVSGSFWGRGVPSRMAEIQDICNTAARQIVKNLAESAGAQWMIDMTQVPPSEALSQSFPGKLWKFAFRPNETRKPLEIFIVPAIFERIQAVYDRWEAMADERILPAYSYGSDRAAGAAQTATGLNMLMAASDVGNKRVVREIDRCVIKPLVERVWLYNMLYDEDQAIKGDTKVAIRGATGHMLKSQQASVLAQFLQMTNNPTDLTIIDRPRRANALRILAARMGETGKDLVPSAEEIIAKMEAEAAAVAQQQAAVAVAPEGAAQPQGAPA